MVNQQLLNYVRQQLSAGIAKDSIKQTLVSTGWTDKDVSDAFAALEVRNPVNPIQTASPSSFIPASNPQPLNPQPAVTKIMPAPVEGKPARRLPIRAIIITLIIFVFVAGVTIGGYYLYTQYVALSAPINVPITSIPTSTPAFVPHTATTTPVLAPVIIKNDYGFSFTVPVGWHVWDGQSALRELFSSTDSAPVTPAKIAGYQEFMNNWNVGSSTVIDVTKGIFDYKSRDLVLAAKYWSTTPDSVDMLDLGITEIMLLNGKVDSLLKKPMASSSASESRNVDVNGTQARFDLTKSYTFVDKAVITLPLTVSTTSASKFQSLAVSRYVAKGDASTTLQDLISFISALNITKNP